MKLAFISDIHGNLEALNRVLERLDADMILCCGDIVGYYSWPNECIKKIAKLNILSVMGNHDFACVTGDTTGFNPYAEYAIKWSREIIKKGNIKFLSALKRKIRLKIDGMKILMVHGSPRDPINEYIFPSVPNYILKSFLADEGVDVLIMGHTHMPFVKKFEDSLVLNPGSVGQPRDSNPKASFSIFDTKKRNAEIYRVSYNIDAVFDALCDAGLPYNLGRRLYYGL